MSGIKADAVQPLALPETAVATIDLRSAPSRLRDEIVIHHTNPDDHIFAIIRRSGWFYEADLLEVLARRLSPDDLVIDVGANIGNHSLYFAAVCGCRVIAIEPNPLGYALLVENIRANGLQDRVQTLNLALGAAKGRARMEQPIGGNLGSATLVASRSGPVRIETLDAVLKTGDVRLIKIDVEGFEINVLKGGMKCLAASRPMVTAEAATRESFGAVEQLLASLGYVSAETCAFTPTHVFEWIAASELRPVLAAIARNSALNAIALHELRSKTKAELMHLRKLVADLTERLEQGSKPPS